MADNAIPIRPDEQNPGEREFERLYAAWRHAQGRCDMESYAPDKFEAGLADELDEGLCEAATDALNAFLLHPVNSAAQLARKLKVFHQEGLYDGWWKGGEIVQQLVRDAHSVAYPELKRD